MSGSVISSLDGRRPGGIDTVSPTLAYAERGEPGVSFAWLMSQFPAAESSCCYERSV
jgi:hypothetical protein